MFTHASTIQNLIDTLPNHPLRRALFLFTFIFGFGGLLFSLYLFFTQATVVSAAVVCPEASQGSNSEFGTIVVYISGAVVKPGLHSLPTNSRLADALAVAGGFDSDADVLFANKNLNLAEKLTDAQQIYIPFLEEGELAAVKKEFVCAPIAELGQSNKVSEGQLQVSGVVAVNSATETELQTLKGIGAARAASIVSQRPFTSLDELVSKKVIPESVFAEIKQNITL